MYRLDSEGNPVAEPDTLAWAKWFETAERIVAQERVGDVEVSTVFLGLNHNYGEGPPLLWQTMTFAKDGASGLDGLQERYASKEAALAGHKAMVAKVDEGPLSVEAS